MNTTTESLTVLAMRELDQAMAAWEKADKVATAARQAMWTVEPLDPRRNQLRAERDAAMAREDEAAAAHREAAKRYRAAVTAERFSR